MELTACTRHRILNPCTLKGRNYQIDPYVGCEHYCYYCYALNTAETDWQKEVMYHDDIAGRLEAELAGIPPQTIYMGWQTDPYQPCEAGSLQTRKVLELLQAKGFSVSILTKSDLVLRDLDLLQKMDGSIVSFSLSFNTSRDRRIFEAATMDNTARIAAMQTLRSLGISSSVLLCPVIPYITDAGQVIDSVARLADRIWVYGLSILNRSDRNWHNLEEILARHYPGLKSRIEAAVFSKDHTYWNSLRDELMRMGRDRNLDLAIHI